MHPTPLLEIDEQTFLRPVEMSLLDELLVACEESWPEVLQAMPWLELSEALEPQLEEFLTDVERLGRAGMLHHWTIYSRDATERMQGLIGFDRSTKSPDAHWNLGYWVRRSGQRRGLATSSIDRVLQWIGGAQGGPVAVELSVDPGNIAGAATVEAACMRWCGRRHPSGDSVVDVAGEQIPHACYIIPRLPLPFEEAVE
jgi:RimJ/RimL family protein N-acetyltransferase